MTHFPSCFSCMRNLCTEEGQVKVDWIAQCLNASPQGGGWTPALRYVTCVWLWIMKWEQKGWCLKKKLYESLCESIIFHFQYLEARIIHRSGFVTKAKLYCSPHDGPVNQDELLWQGIVTLFRNPAGQQDGGLESPSHLSRVSIQVSFILKGEGEKSSISWFWSAAAGAVLIPSFL